MNASSQPDYGRMPISRCQGPVLRHHREASKQTLEQVAEKAGITPLALHNLETGKACSRSDTYERVAKALGVHYLIVMLEAYLLSAERQ